MSLIIPFLGDRAEAVDLLERLDQVALGPGDEAIVADNTAVGVARGAAQQAPVRVVAACEERSSYYARNRGAEEARGEWLLFLDADCLAPADLVDAYFRHPISASTGAVGGEVVGVTEQSRLAARYTRSRRYLSQARHHAHHKPYAVTANLLVRTRAWREAGGFLEGVRSGADSDFCWRLAQLGWGLELRTEAAVEHRHRESLPALARQVARYAASAAWLNRRYGRAFRRPRLARVARGLAAAARWTLAGQPERARLRAVDALVEGAGWVGYQRSNAAGGDDDSRARWNRAARAAGGTGTAVVLLADSFPHLSETFVAAEARALAEQGLAVRVEAVARAVQPDRSAARELAVAYAEDDSRAAKLRDGAWLASRHPLRCLGDLAGRRRWRREEDAVPLRALAPAARRLARSGERHLHAHFAGQAALRALRLARLAGIGYSVTAHAYEIWREPRNLVEKLRKAAFVTTGCDYNVRHLRALAGPGDAERIHEIVMGVDGERFRRRTPYPGGRTVAAVGRLVPKKGFGVLVEATGLMRGEEPLERLVIGGDGPLRRELADRIHRLGLDDVVDLTGPMTHEEVRVLLEQAAVLAMPCVVAHDGDRDSMPVVVKEALAMEVPVVASDEVGLPEVVRSEWGRLVPPGDPRALAGALSELLALPQERRAAMGGAGRDHVLRHCDLGAETAKLAALIEAQVRAQPRRRVRTAAPRPRNRRS